MVLEAKKKAKETSQSLIYRFIKITRKSGILLRARATRFFQRRKSRQLKKRTALRREELKKEYKELKKLGRLKE